MYLAYAVIAALIGTTGLAWFNNAPNPLFAAPTQSARIERTILPETDSTWELGTSSKAWLRIFTDELCLNTDCKTAWPSGSGSSFSTTSADYWAHASTTLPKTYLANTWSFLQTLAAGFLSQASSTVVGTLTVTGGVVGNASTATSLAANGANASAGNAILGVDASGAAEGAFDVWTEAENTSAAYAAQATTITIAGTANQITSSAGAQSLAANRTWTLSIPTDFRVSSTTLSGNTLLTNATSTNFAIGNVLTFNGVTGSTWAAFCTTITGGSALCDGDDATSAAVDSFTHTPFAGLTTSATTSALRTTSLLAASSTNFNYASTTLLTVSGPTTWLTNTSANLKLGDSSSQSTASPTILNMGGTYADTVVSSKAKWKLYEDGTSINTYGIGITAGQFNFFKLTGGSYNWLFSDADEMKLTESALSPGANDGNALGTTALGWADLHLASGGVINWTNSDVTLTHSTNKLTLSSGDNLTLSFASTTALNASGTGFFGTASSTNLITQYASSSVLTVDRNAFFPYLTSALLATDSTGKLVSTTTIGAGLIAGLPTAANPTGTVGLAAVNGSATTFLRSDGAPVLSQAIAPTWSALHIFDAGTLIRASSTVTTGLFSMNGGASTTGITVTGTASTSAFFANGLTTCNGGNVLTWSGGTFGCAADAQGSGSWPFLTTDTNYGKTPQQSTTTPMWFKATPYSMFASSTAIFTNASSTLLSVTDALVPDVEDGADIGINVTGQFNNVYLAAGSLISWNSGGVTLSESASTLIVDTGSFDLASAGIALDATDGVLTILGKGNGADESLTIDLDNGGANVITFGTGSAATKIDWGAFTIDLDSGELLIPGAANPTVATANELAIDTTAASTSLRFHDGTAERYLYPEKPRSFYYATTTSVAGTTTMKVSGHFHSATYNKQGCVSSGGTFKVQIGNGHSSSTVTTSGTASTTFTTLASNNVFYVGDNIYIAFGTPSATGITNLSCTFGFIEAD